MNERQLLVELYKDAPRQGPGGKVETRRSVALSGLSAHRNLKIADIGCGSGASTVVLARELDACITAVDLIPEFLNRLKTKAERAGVADRIETLEASMEDLPFEPAELDAIWSEGAIYNMGFAAGVAAWRNYLKPGGVLAISELIWLTSTRPPELERYWEGEYGEIDTASGKIAVLENQGFSPLGYFALPKRCWTENYYQPLKQRLASFLESCGKLPEAPAIAEAERHEISLYERYNAYFGYGYFVARKTGS